jgi:hypothetical protein
LVELLPKVPVYGVPRGGTVIAGLTHRAVSRPEDAEIIVDDIRDSGRTERKWKGRYPDKPFFSLFTARPGEWLIFPWEEENKDADYATLATRLLQHGGLKVTEERVQELSCHLQRYIDTMI